MLCCWIARPTQDFQKRKDSTRSNVISSLRDMSVLLDVIYHCSNTFNLVAHNSSRKMLVIGFPHPTYHKQFPTTRAPIQIVCVPISLSSVDVKDWLGWHNQDIRAYPTSTPSRSPMFFSTVVSRHNEYFKIGCILSVCIRVYILQSRSDPWTTDSPNYQSQQNHFHSTWMNRLKLNFCTCASVN